MKILNRNQTLEALISYKCLIIQGVALVKYLRYKELKKERKEN